jgi:hypothetical protein
MDRVTERVNLLTFLYYRLEYRMTRLNFRVPQITIFHVDDMKRVPFTSEVSVAPCEAR